MSEETIFEGDKPEEKVAEAPVLDTPTTPVIPTELQGIVGEGKKYSTVEAAYASIEPAQNHIATIEAENASLKQTLEGQRTTRELVDELRSTQATGETTPRAEVNQEHISTMVNQELTKIEQSKVKAQNNSTVAQRFIKQYGTKGEEVYNKLAKDSGLTVADLNIIAANSPTAVFKMAGFEHRQTDVSPTMGSVNTQAYQAEPTGDLNSKVKSFDTKDVKTAWAIAGEKAKKNLGLN